MIKLPNNLALYTQSETIKIASKYLIFSQHVKWHNINTAYPYDEHIKDHATAVKCQSCEFFPEKEKNLPEKIPYRNKQEYYYDAANKKIVHV